MSTRFMGPSLETPVWHLPTVRLKSIFERLEDAAVIAVPGEHRRGAAIRAPRLGKLAQLLLARLFGKPHQSSDLDQDGKISCGEDVGAALGEQQIDFRRPAADALDLGEQSDRFLIVRRQIAEVELPRNHA